VLTNKNIKVYYNRSIDSTPTPTRCFKYLNGFYFFGEDNAKLGYSSDFSAFFTIITVDSVSGPVGDIAYGG
jgi:hypothetical protein